MRPRHRFFETLAAQQRNGWDARDPSIPAPAWTPAVRAQYEAVGQAMRSAADQMVPLVELTPHRVMRELYEQFIAYARAYVERIPTYTAADDHLVGVSNSVMDSISRICAAINYGSASARGPLVPSASSPEHIAALGNPADPQRFLTEPNSACADWDAALSQFGTDTVDWLAIPLRYPRESVDTRTTGGQRRSGAGHAYVRGQTSSTWRAKREPNISRLRRFVGSIPRAYGQALPTYTASDNYLAGAALRLSGIVLAACQAAGSS